MLPRRTPAAVCMQRGRCSPAIPTAVLRQHATAGRLMNSSIIARRRQLQLRYDGRYVTGSRGTTSRDVNRASVLPAFYCVLH